MEIKKALKILNIEEQIKRKSDEATQFAIRGMFECCQEINEAIKVVRKFLSES